MKAVISCVFHKVVSLLHKVGSLFRNAGSLLRKAGPSSRRADSSFRKADPLFRRVGPFFRKVGSPLRKVAPLLSKVGFLFRKVGASLYRLIRKSWQLPPGRRMDRALQRTWKRTKPLKYHFLPYVTSVLRVLGWAVLIIGVLASILLGLEIMNDGLMVWKTELRGVGMGVSAIVLGIIGSFLAWLFLLVSRELVYLFIHVKENTRNTAERITEESG